MPTLPSLFRDVLDDEPLPLTGAYADVFERFSSSELRLIARHAHNLLGDGVGPALLELGLFRTDIPEPLPPQRLREHEGFARILAGAHSLREGEPDGDLITLVQHAMQAVSARVAGAPEGMRMCNWGADGSFGHETRRALAALRRFAGRGFSDGPRSELLQSDAAQLLQLLESAPVPDFWRELPRAPVRETVAERIVDIAKGICDATRSNPFRMRVDGRTYTYAAEHFGVDAVENGMLLAPGGIGYGMRMSDTGYWKCNIFGGVVLALAELPVPSHRVGRYRHYPRAERFGDRLARKRGWHTVHYFDHRDPADPHRALVGHRQEQDILQMLRDSRPGDLSFVDHPGAPGSNGGHTRVCTEPAMAGDADTAPKWAMAAAVSAIERRDGLAKLGAGKEMQFWLLRYRG